MARPCPILRASLIALAAIAGMLLTADGAVAGPNRGARSAQMRGDDCCRVGRPAVDCCCESKASAPVTVSEDGDRPAGMVGAIDIQNRPWSSQGNCECRESEPVAPAGTPVPRAPEERSDSHRAAAPVEFAVAAPAVRTWTSRIIASAPGSARSPLYLRNARLLI
jgi:hypothetical protein